MTEKTSLEEGWIVERERALAWLRLAFAVLAVVVIKLNPSRITNFPLLSFVSLFTFLVYSVAILWLMRKNKFDAARIIAITTPLDVIWIALIVFSTGGSRTPFFTYYSFPVISASLRWGIRGSLPVAFIGTGIYGIIRITLAAETEAEPLGIDTFLVRAFYMIALAAIFGYISEFEKKQNRKLLALSRTAGQLSALQERRRIIFDLHDGILQSLATLILRLEACRRRLREYSESALQAELNAIEELSRNSMKEIRQFLAGKESRPLTQGMLLKRLKEELRFLQQSLGMEAILETEPDEVDLPEDVETEIYYVFREGLANVTRHAHASRVTIQLTQRANSLEGAIEDNGAGMNPAAAEKGEGFGLASMRERISKIGGELKIQSSPGNGSKISFFVPLQIERLNSQDAA